MGSLKWTTITTFKDKNCPKCQTSINIYTVNRRFTKEGDRFFCKCGQALKCFQVTTTTEI